MVCPLVLIKVHGSSPANSVPHFGSDQHSALCSPQVKLWFHFVFKPGKHLYRPPALFPLRLPARFSITSEFPSRPYLGSLQGTADLREVGASPEISLSTLFYFAVAAAGWRTGVGTQVAASSWRSKVALKLSHLSYLPLRDLSLRGGITATCVILCFPYLCFLLLPKVHNAGGADYPLCPILRTSAPHPPASP